MKPEWGTKHTCLECSTKFYDMKRAEVICPKCETPYVEPVKPKRAKPAKPAKPAPKPVEPPKKKVVADEDEIDLEIDDDDDDDDSVIEDTSDFDNNDVAVVVKPVEDDRET
jgi:hypothetical protein